MTTPAQTAGGKGKKKNKEVLKVSLDEFNQIDAPVGHSVVNVKVSGLDWAATMANYEQSSETQQIIVPSAPRSHRGPGVDFESLPNEPPFRVSVFNLPLSVEDRDISERFFSGLDVKHIEVTKSSTTVEFGSKDSLYEALCKDGTSFKNKTINVCLYGQQPQTNSYGSGGYGGRGGFGDRYGDRYNDRYDRNQGSNTYAPPRSDRYERPSFQRDSYGSGGGGGGGGFNRQGPGAGYGAPRGGGYNDRYNDRGNFREERSHYSAGGGEPAEEEQTNWRDRPTLAPAPAPSYNHGSRPSYNRQTPYQSYQQPSHQSDSNYQPRYNSQPSNNYPLPSSHHNNQSDNPPEEPIPQERPKLILNKRKVPLKLDEPATRNPAIFGEAKPSNKPYEKMAEVEEKLKAIQIKDKPKDGPPSAAGSQTGSQPGSAPRSRKVSSNHDEAS